MRGGEVMSDADSPGVMPAGPHETDESLELPDHPNLLKPSMFAAGWWISVAFGLVLVAVALYHTLPELGDAKLAFARRPMQGASRESDDSREKRD